MKTGTVAKRFDLDQKTIKMWTDTFPDHFSEGARGEGRTQRDYQMEDLWVLNTIKIERTRNVPFEQIAAKLAAGDIDTNLPPEFTSIEGESAIAVYSELKGYQIQIESLTQEVDRLRADGKEKDEKIERLNREIGKWQAMYEMLKEQRDNDE
ncbi:MAG: MerR family transcriptional regulator [Anaerolineae bacterium]